uniref:MIF4G domain-containing protein n=1 Tax=Heterorhabditis bacteriophora TaxID=37862 RepID=A0A1I7XG88_HETBA
MENGNIVNENIHREIGANYVPKGGTDRLFASVQPKLYRLLYAITAANGHESSWGTYCDNDMELPCLGDLFSVNWMDDSDEEDLGVETLSDQYELVKKETDKSHVMHFGDLKIAKEPVGWFQGDQRRKTKPLRISANKDAKDGSWPARDIELMYLHRQKEMTNDIYETKSINKKIRKIHEDRRKVKAQYYKVVDALISDPIDRRRILEERNIVEDLGCHDSVTRIFHLLCINFNEYDYALKYVYILNNLCIELGNSKHISNTFLDVCNFGRL